MQMVKQSILQIIKNCLEISKKGHSSTHGVNSKSASTGTPRTNTNDQSRTSGKGRAAGATKPDEYLSNVDTQLNKEQSVAIEQERLLETFEYLIEYFFEFYVCRGPGLKQITELNGRKYFTFSDLNSVSIEDGSLLKTRAKDAYGQLDQTSKLAVLFDLVVSGMEAEILNRQHESESAPLITSEPVASKSALKRKKKKNTHQFIKKFASATDFLPILSHFPPMPPEHSYLTTKLTLHPIEDGLELREKKVEFEATMDRNLKKMVSLQLDAAKKRPAILESLPKEGGRVSAAAIEAAFDFFGFGFVNSLGSSFQ